MQHSHLLKCVAVLHGFARNCQYICTESKCVLTLHGACLNIKLHVSCRGSPSTRRVTHSFSCVVESFGGRGFTHRMYVLHVLFQAGGFFAPRLRLLFPGGIKSPGMFYVYPFCKLAHRPTSEVGTYKPRGLDFFNDKIFPCAAAFTSP